MSEVRLSAGRLGDALAIVEQKRKFKFIVGKEESEHVCSLLQACFISGKVSRLVSSDSSIDVLHVLPNESCRHFELLERLWNGDSIIINGDNFESLSKLSEELENSELHSILVNYMFISEEISLKNCIQRLNQKTNLNLDFKEELEFLSSNFSEFEISALSVLSLNHLEMILTHGELKIESENSLFDFILDRFSSDESYSTLFKYIRFEYLDAEHIDLFFNCVYPDYIDSVLWESITNFIKNCIQKSPPRRNISKGTFEYKTEGPFNGIISHLRQECNGNPHTKGIMAITTSGNDCNQCHQVVDYGWGDWWYSSNKENSWIQFDFIDRSVSVESYTIKSGKLTGVPSHPRHWVIEGSNDAQSWSTIDSQDNSDLNGNCCTKHFKCSTELSGTLYRYIRMRQTGQNCFNANRLWLSEIEFFGVLK